MYPKLQDLPEECIREIILRINDHRDLESSSAAWTLMAALASEQRVWRELTQFHFNQNQIDLIVEKKLNSLDGSCENNEPNGGMERRKDWQKIYHALRRYGGEIQKNSIHNFFTLYSFSLSLQKIRHTRRLSIFGDFGIVSILLLLILAIGRTSVHCTTIARFSGPFERCCWRRYGY